MYNISLSTLISIGIFLIQINVSSQTKDSVFMFNDATFRITKMTESDSLGTDSIRLIYNDEGVYDLYYNPAILNYNNFKKENAATSRKGKNKYFEISTDQDVLSKNNEDRDYTMGVRLQFYQTNKDYPLIRYIRIPFGLALINKYFNKFSTIEFNKSYSMGLTHSAFTPYHLELYEIDSTDRPFAGVILLNSRSNYLLNFKNKNGLGVYTNLSFEGNLGIIGKCPSRISSFIQAGIHAGQAVIINDTFPLSDTVNRKTRPIPRGWPNAIGGNKNIPIFNYTLAQSFGINLIVNRTNCSAISKFRINMNGGGQLRIGNLYTSIGGTLMGEFGWYDIQNFSNNSSFFYDASVTGYSPEKKDNQKNENCIDFSFLINYEYDYWLYNATLLGSVLYNSPYTISNHQMKEFTNFFTYGFRIRLNNIILSYQKAFRSPVTNLDPNRIQSFGRVSIIFRY